MTKTSPVTELEMASAALVALAEHGIPHDIQELLVHGSKRQGIPPGAFSKAIKAVLSVAQTPSHTDATKAREALQKIISERVRQHIHNEVTKRQSDDRKRKIFLGDLSDD